MPREAAWLLLFAVVAAGCSQQPYAAGEDPDRPSVSLGERVVYGEAVWLNGTVRVSPLPGMTAPLTSPDDPVGCFFVDDAESESASYLGGVSFELQWVSPSAPTGTLQVNIRSAVGASAGWAANGTSPLLLAFNITDEDPPMRTPLIVEVAPVQETLVFEEVVATYRLAIGILESEIRELSATQCGQQMPAL